jgi:hypothetical protein
MVEVLNEWFLVESSQNANPIKNGNSFNLSNSYNASLSNSDNRMNTIEME